MEGAGLATNRKYPFSLDSKTRGYSWHNYLYVELVFVVFVLPLCFQLKMEAMDWDNFWMVPWLLKREKYFFYIIYMYRLHNIFVFSCKCLILPDYYKLLVYIFRIKKIRWIQCWLKGITSDSNNIFLWHQSEDISKKESFFPPKFQLIQITHLQVMHDYVHWYCFIDYCVKWILIDKIRVKIAFILTLKWQWMAKNGQHFLASLTPVHRGKRKEPDFAFLPIFFSFLIFCRTGLIGQFKGGLLPKPKFSMFCTISKLSTLFLKDDICILKQLTQNGIKYSLCQEVVELLKCAKYCFDQ